MADEVVDKKVSERIAYTICAVWAISYLADIVVSNYSPSPLLHVIMLGLGGAAFGRSFIQATRVRKHGEENDIGSDTGDKSTEA